MKWHTKPRRVINVKHGRSNRRNAEDSRLREKNWKGGQDLDGNYQFYKYFEVTNIMQLHLTEEWEQSQKDETYCTGVGWQQTGKEKFNERGS